MKKILLLVIFSFSFSIQSHAEELTVKTVNEGSALSALWSSIFKTNAAFYTFVSKNSNDPKEVLRAKELLKNEKEMKLPQFFSNGKNWRIEHAGQSYLVVVNDLSKRSLTISGRPYTFDPNKGPEQFFSKETKTGWFKFAILPEAQAQAQAVPAAIGYGIFGLMTFAICRDERHGDFLDCALAGVFSPMYWTFRAINSVFDKNPKNVSKQQFDELVEKVEQKFKDGDITLSSSDKERIRSMIREQLDEYSASHPVQNKSSGAVR